MTKEEFKKVKKVNRDPEDQGFLTILDLLNGKSEAQEVLERNNAITTKQQTEIEQDLKKQSEKEEVK